jgi:pimeloyl-ACP methyl ester carboxylesterase
MAGSYASELATPTFGDGLQVAVAVHGITASAMAWSVAARAMPREWTLVAPDLGGRGASADLPGPYGLDRHTDDICTLARSRGEKVVLVGHSMGAYVALLSAAAHPELFSRLILIDGGPSMPLPADLDPTRCSTRRLVRRSNDSAGPTPQTRNTSKCSRTTRRWRRRHVDHNHPFKIRPGRR